MIFTKSAVVTICNGDHAFRWQPSTAFEEFVEFMYDVIHGLGIWWLSGSECGTHTQVTYEHGRRLEKIYGPWPS